MGICASAEYMQVQEYDEKVVYVMDEESAEDGMRRLASLYSQKGMKGPNQDSVILCQGFGMEDGIFCGVFDGHGRSGHHVSRLVRDYLPFMILSQRNSQFIADDDFVFSDGSRPASSSTDSSDSSLPSPTSPQIYEEWREACLKAFKAMDGELKMQSNLDAGFSGSTAVSIIKQGKDLIIANLGDSRAVLATISKDGRLEAVPLTTDLKPNLPHEAERIRKCHGRVFALKDEPHIQRVWLPDEDYPGLAMARSFGDFRLKQYGVISTPQISYRRITNRDLFIILATDGVWDVLSNEQVATIVWSTARKEDASRAVVEAAVHIWRTRFAGCRVDDCSAVCLFLQDIEQGVN